MYGISDVIALCLRTGLEGYTYLTTKRYRCVPDKNLGKSDGFRTRQVGETKP